MADKSKTSRPRPLGLFYRGARRNAQRKAAQRLNAIRVIENKATQRPYTPVKRFTQTREAARRLRQTEKLS